MKKPLYHLVIIIMTVVSLYACKEKEPVDPSKQPVENNQNDAVTSVGQPIGAAVSRVIGPQGGTLSDSSGRFTLSIPQGALKNDVNISIQPLTNHAPAGRGDAFRLLPHGQTFEKPVSLTVNYDQSESEGTIEEALGICYQNDQKKWLAIGGGSRDTLTNIVKIQTTHFSDWAVFAAIELTPEVEGVDPGGEVPLLVLYRFKTNRDEDWLEPLVEPVETVLQNSNQLLDPKYIESWEKQGEGILQANNNKAKYIAPPQIPFRNPVEIVVRVRTGKSIGLLISRIFVAPPGISVSVANRGWHSIPGGGYNRYGAVNLIAADQDGHSVKLFYDGQTYGQRKWTVSTVGCTYSINTKQIYYHVYGSRPDVSKGNLNVTFRRTELGRGEEIVLGTFEILTSGYLDTRKEVPEYSSTSMRGVFRVPRLD